METFSEALRRLRGQLGYKSARAFYNGRGGQSHFGCTYRQYINVETGNSSPSPQLIEKIAIGLRLMEDKGRAREFFRAYLLSVCRKKDVVDLITNAFSEESGKMAGAQPPLARSMAHTAEKRTKVLTTEQSRFLSAGKENYWPFAMLVNDKGRWTASELASLSDTAETSTSKILKKLVKLKLICRDGKGRYYCPEPGTFYRHPTDKIYPGELTPLRRIWREMSEKKGESMLSTCLFTRASRHEIKQYIPYLLQSLKGCDVCTTLSKGKDTGFFMVELGVRKVLDF